jgi:hypothetical protein
MQGKIIPYYLPVLHHESNTLKLGDVGDRISGHSHKIGKAAGLDRAHAVFPSQEFCGICCDCANDVEGRHSSALQG